MEISMNKFFLSEVGKLSNTKLISLLRIDVVIFDFVLVGAEDNFSVGLFGRRWVCLIELSFELVKGYEGALL